MKVAYSVFVALFGVTLAGCAFEQIAAQQRAADIKKKFETAVSDCKTKFPTDDRKTIVASMQCMDQALAIEVPELGANADLAQNFMTYRMTIAERFQNGRITHAQAAKMLADKWSQLNNEAQSRNTLAQTAAAQQKAADAAATAADWEAFGNAVATANAAFAAPQQHAAASGP
jgi:hypothetical protein